MRTAIRTSAVLLVTLTACGEGRGDDTVGTGGDAIPSTAPGATSATPADPVKTGPAGDGRTIRVWFSRRESPEAVERSVDSAGPAAAVNALVQGPTAEERARGLTSWFSDSTAGAVRSLRDADGFVVVDFQDIDRLIPGAASSAGSEQLLTALDSTVFQFEAVDSAEYRLDGSCEAFWNWLQRGCTVVRRP